MMLTEYCGFVVELGGDHGAYLPATWLKPLLVGVKWVGEPELLSVCPVLSLKQNNLTGKVVVSQ